MTVTTIIQQMKKNARNNLRKQYLRVVIGVEAVLWAFIALAWLIKTLR
jgi:hypothetical protein